MPGLAALETSVAAPARRGRKAGGWLCRPATTAATATAAAARAGAAGGGLAPARPGRRAGGRAGAGWGDRCAATAAGPPATSTPAIVLVRPGKFQAVLLVTIHAALVKHAAT